MTKDSTRWAFIFLPLFILSLVAAGYFALQLRRSSPPEPAGFLAAYKDYGVTIDLTRYGEAALPKTLAGLGQNGLTWLRQPVNWADIEPQPGQFDWQPLDRIVEAIQQESEETFHLLVVLQTTPAWARPENSSAMTPPAEVSDFGNFARALAGRYGDQIDFYQIWHEPNLSANWGNTYVDPAAYAHLLREAALNIRAADPEAYLLTAALAPTLEPGPLNLNEITYLDQLYQAQASAWFEIVAAQLYGFDSEPSDPAQPHLLNFRRVELLRQVMLAHNDAETPVWATAFGWNSLPAGWTGRPSPWKSGPADLQAQRTAAAIKQARRDWPWLGPLLAIRWDTTGLNAVDPARGFALNEHLPLLETMRTAAQTASVATPGAYPPGHPTGAYSSGWRFAPDRADAPRHEPRTLTIPFEGTRLDLALYRGPFRGYLWVTVDGHPANALPHAETGQSYVVLYDPLYGSETVTLARHLPPGPHEAVIEAEGGWGQWAIGGWTVYHELDTRPWRNVLMIAAIVAGLSGLGTVWWLIRSADPLTKSLWAWSEIIVAVYAILREQGQLLLTFALAIVFYLAPGSLALLLLPLLGFALLLRPDLGLALIAFSLSFFQAPKQLPIGSFSPVELTLALTLPGFIFRGFLTLAQTIYLAPEMIPESVSANPKLPITNDQLPITDPQTVHPPPPTPQSPNLPISQSPLARLASPDFAALALLLLSLLATFAAENFGVSMREWRVVVFESVLFYYLVRLGSDFGSPERLDPPAWRWAWRLIDSFVAGATLQALLAVYLYFFTELSITAEGVHRALGLAYGSPNNLSLFLDRAWPILLAVTLLPGPGRRRWLYGAGFVFVSLALYLTFSKGALLLGLPAGLVAMTLFYTLRERQPNWRRTWLMAGGGLLLLVLALLPLSQTERFRTTFDFSAGSTGFFRLKLWQAALTMLGEHWPLGVGLDNFLYQYRTRYILPEAWQEPNLSHPHNLILDFGTRLGLGGLAILLWLQVAFWQTAWRLYRATASPLVLGLMASMVTFLAHGLVDNSYFLVDLAFTFFLTVGIVQRLHEETL